MATKKTTKRASAKKTAKTSAAPAAKKEHRHAAQGDTPGRAGIGAATHGADGDGIAVPGDPDATHVRANGDGYRQYER